MLFFRKKVQVGVQAIVTLDKMRDYLSLFVCLLYLESVFGFLPSRLTLLHTPVRTCTGVGTSRYRVRYLVPVSVYEEV
jgi:hypothetical protein